MTRPSKQHPNPDFYDQVVVDQALAIDGRPSRELTYAEKVAVVWSVAGRDRADATCKRVGISGALVRQVLRGEAA